MKRALSTLLLGIGYICFAQTTSSVTKDTISKGPEATPVIQDTLQGKKLPTISKEKLLKTVQSIPASKSREKVLPTLSLKSVAPKQSR